MNAMKSHSEGVPLILVTSRKELTRASVTKDELSFDKERARKLFGVIYKRFVVSGNAETMIKTCAPQWKYRPRAIEFGSSEHERWLFFAGSTDLRTESEDVYRAHQLLWENKKHQLPTNSTSGN